MITDRITTKHKLFIMMSFFSYVVLAIPFTIQGANAPVTMDYYGINAAQQGAIMTLQSAGGLCTALFIAMKGEKYNKIHSIALGLLILCLAASAIGFAPAYTVLLAIIVAVGVGNAFIDIMMNSVVSDVYPAHKNTVLPLVHAFFSVGAMLTPLFVTLTVNPDAPASFSRPFRFLGVIAAVVFLFYLLNGRRIMGETPYVDMGAMKKRATENPAEIFKTGTAWYFMAVGFLYFTFQLGTIAWLPTYAIRNIGVDFGTGGMMLTAFFGGALPMRFLGPLILRRLTARALYMVSGFSAAALVLAALFTDNAQAVFVLVAAAGFMQGSSVATFILMCCETFPDRTASASSLATLASSVATLTAPLWMGAMSESTGFRLPFILICCALFASAGLVLRFRPGPDVGKNKT